MRGPEWVKGRLRAQLGRSLAWVRCSPNPGHEAKRSVWVRKAPVPDSCTAACIASTVTANYVARDRDYIVFKRIEAVLDFLSVDVGIAERCVHGVDRNRCYDK